MFHSQIKIAHCRVLCHISRALLSELLYSHKCSLCGKHDMLSSILHLISAQSYLEHSQNATLPEIMNPVIMTGSVSGHGL